MTEETKDEPIEYDLSMIIDSAIYVLTSLAELDGITLAEDKEDIVTLRKHCYKVIYTAQRKMMQQIKLINPI